MNLKYHKLKRWHVFFIILAFIFLYIYSLYKNKKNAIELYDNMEITIAQTIGYSYFEGCVMRYVYEMSLPSTVAYYGTNNYKRYYVGETYCVTGKEYCQKFLLIYSKNNPDKSVLIAEIPLSDSISINDNLDRYRSQITIDLIERNLKHKISIRPSNITYTEYIKLLGVCITNNVHLDTERGKNEKTYDFYIR